MYTSVCYLCGPSVRITDVNGAMWVGSTVEWLAAPERWLSTTSAFEGRRTLWRHFTCRLPITDFCRLRFHKKPLELAATREYSTSAHSVCNVNRNRRRQTLRRSPFDRRRLGPVDLRRWCAAENPHRPAAVLTRFIFRDAFSRIDSRLSANMAANNYFGFTHGGTQYAWVW